MKLTKRDLEILDFTFDMKFSDVELLNKSFFKRKVNDGWSESLKYTYDRIALLKKNELLKSKTKGFGGKEILSLTRLGYETLINMKVDKDFAGFTVEPNLKYFNHDHHVSLCRIFLEKIGAAKNWTSERSLHSNCSLAYGLSKTYLPDALFTNRLGVQAAFEMEIARKAKKMYQEKIDKFVSTIRSHFNEPMGFKRVLFVVVKPEVCLLLKERTQIYPEIFKVVNFSELQSDYLKGVHYGQP